ncbi:phospholipase D-like domain-containing protein [Candidatus Riflebacteria bacterium]
MKKNILNYVLIIAFLFIVSFAGNSTLFSNEARGSFKIYRSALKEYQNAIKEGKSRKLTNQLFQTYQEAKSRYEQEIGLGGNTIPLYRDESFQKLAEKDSPKIIESLAGKQKVASKKTDSVEDKLIAGLYKPDAYKNPDKAINALKAFLKKNPDTDQKEKLIYELARAYQRLKGDLKTATTIFKKLAGPSSSYLNSMQPKSLYALKANFKLKLLSHQMKLNSLLDVVEMRRTSLGIRAKKWAASSWFNVAGRVYHAFRFMIDNRKFYYAVKRHNKYKEEAQYYLENNPLRDRMSVEEVFYSLKAEEDLHNSKVRLILENDEAWRVRWYLLNLANESIDITYYIVEDKIFGKALLGKLLEKAEAGLKIRLMMDARGSKNFKAHYKSKDYLQELMRYKNVEIKVYNPITKNLLKIFSDLRTIIACTHQKLFIVDGRYGVTGGRNIGPVNFVSSKDIATVNRDTDIVFEGEYICRSMKKAFDLEFKGLQNSRVKKDFLGNIYTKRLRIQLAAQLMDLFISTGKILKPEDSKCSTILKPLVEEIRQYPSLYRSDFQFFPDYIVAPTKLLTKNGDLDVVNEITGNLIRFIDASEKEVIMQNPYVVFTRRVRSALERASRRGVKIVLHTNSPISNNQLLAQAMFHNDWKGLLKSIPTLKLYAYKHKSLVHSKVFVFDKLVSVVGTYNLDYLSEQINGENIALILSEEFAKQNLDAIQKDIDISVEYRIKVLENGDIKVIFGPEDHPGIEKILKKVRFYQKLKFIRPFI